VEENGAPLVERSEDFSSLPVTDKKTYINRFSIEERCAGGRLPPRGVVIDESSGSSGVPNNWVRGPQERQATKRSIQRAFRAHYGDGEVFMINCFALGAWATGMNVSMAIADQAILKSVGPDKAKLDATLKLFGPRYRYVLAGYPPFFKDWLATTAVDLAGYQLDLVVGGEGISEGLRGHFLERCKTVYSSYGASDLEINVGVETPFTVALRGQCARRPDLARKLFGREDAPMIFQYNPLDFLIEASAERELIFTVLRTNNASPRVRYNIRDIGGILSFDEAERLVRQAGVELDSRQAYPLPLLFVYGRNDLSVPFYGAKVFSTDLDQILNGDAGLREAFFAFQLSVREEASLDKRLVIDLERAAGVHDGPADEELAARLFTDLQRVNQDFREVSRVFGPDRLLVRQHPFGSGPFATRDIRVKNRYLG
jgi:phenylacetate-CoA ligase